MRHKHRKRNYFVRRLIDDDTQAILTMCLDERKVSVNSQWLSHYQNCRNCLSLVATTGERGGILGFLMIAGKQIDDIWVSKSYRRKGIGTALIETLEEPRIYKHGTIGVQIPESSLLGEYQKEAQDTEDPTDLSVKLTVKPITDEKRKMYKPTPAQFFLSRTGFVPSKKPGIFDAELQETFYRMRRLITANNPSSLIQKAEEKNRRYQ